MSEIEDEALSLDELLTEVRRIELASRKLVTELLAGGYASVFRGTGIEFSEVREYVAGDDPRSVDWNVTAKMGRPFVKKFIDERELTVLFLLDLSESMRAGFGAESARHLAARFVALLGLSAARNHDKTGLIAFDQDVVHEVPPRTGTGHVLRLVRDTLALRGLPRPSALEPLLEHVGRAQRKRAVIFLVSDFLYPLPEKALGRLARRHDLVAVRIAVPEASAPARGLLRLHDPETGEECLVDWSSARVRRAFRENVARARAAQDAVLDEARVDRLDLQVAPESGERGLVKPLLRFFHMREARGARR